MSHTRKGQSSSLSEMPSENFTTAFLPILDKDEIITKLATVLSALINLVLPEKLNPLIAKLDGIIFENRALHNKISNVEQENGWLKQISDSLQSSIVSLNVRVNILAWAATQNNISVLRSEKNVCRKNSTCLC